MYRLTADFDAEPERIEFLESLLRRSLVDAAERIDVHVDHWRIDLIPEEPTKE